MVSILPLVSSVTVPAWLLLSATAVGSANLNRAPPSPPHSSMLMSLIMSLTQWKIIFEPRIKLSLTYFDQL